MPGKITYLDHPLITHKISSIRGIEVVSATFRENVQQIAMLEAYEALRNVATYDKKIRTPIEETVKPFIDESKVCLVPILRAGLGMQEGISRILPHAKVCHVGMKRDEETHEAHTYYCNLPQFKEDETILLLDPMLATGGSGVDAVDLLKAHGAKKIAFLSIIAAPEGVKRFHDAHPDVDLYVGALDERLNENAYICPGLGDAGDRIFGTI